MNQITLKNGTTVDVVQINGQGRFFQGANRDSLEFHFPKEGNSFETLEPLFTEANTAKITVTNDAGSFVYNDYSLKAGMALVPVVITPAQGTDPEVSEERYTVTMAQKTYAEKQLEATAANSMIALEGLAEIYETLIVGGVI